MGIFNRIKKVFSKTPAQKVDPNWKAPKVDFTGSSFSEVEQKRLLTCNQDLIQLMLEVDRIYPIFIICGHRNKADQEAAVARGASKLHFPFSKHNGLPSMAVDIAPNEDLNDKTLDWNDVEEFKRMCSIVELKAKELGIKIRLGRDFSFKDYPHVELV